MSKTITQIDDNLYQYMLDNWLREDALLRQLREETATLEMAAMQISPDQGQFMQFMVQCLGAKKIVEIGTFTGYSALAMAQVLPDDGLIICCDLSEEWTAIGRKYWRQAGVADKIDLRLAPALDTLDDLRANASGHFDFAFIDADKSNYDSYFESCLELIRPGGVIAIDNVFWGGSVVDDSQQDEDTAAIRALNKKLQGDNRVSLSIVPIGDGLTLARKNT
jgi:predicted O-methyltransferase YrrM